MATAAAAACARGPDVVRVFDGEARVGPYITHETYAAYARGALLEASGEYQQAEVSYEKALADSPESAAIWVRLAAVRCRLGGAIEPGLAQARRLNPDYAPIWREWALCTLERGQASEARALAERALALDPDDESTTLLLARIEEQLGNEERSAELLLAHGIRGPGSGAVWRAALDLAERTKDPTLAALARAGLDRAGLPDPTYATQRARSRALLDAIDRALLADELDLARQLAPRARLSADALAVRAAVIGAARAALNQADFVLEADATNTDAWIAGLVAADLLDDEACFEDRLTRWSPPNTAPRPEAARLLGALLERRMGPEAARAWLQATQSSAATVAPTE